MAKRSKKGPSDARSSDRTPHLLDLDMSARGGALPAVDDELPRETPDTQESLAAPDEAYRVDEFEGDGPRHVAPIRSADGAAVIYANEDELDDGDLLDKIASSKDPSPP